MAYKEQRERLFGIAHVLALRAVERSPDERRAFIESEVEEIRREYARDYGQSPIPEQIGERMVRWTEAMVQILEEAGTIGQA
jgi:predicted DNA-binding transcriptional regulator AlpA